MFYITYDYSTYYMGVYRNYRGNYVGRDGNTPVGYGPVGPPSHFRAEELPQVIDVLTKQLGQVPTLHLHPQPD